MKAGERRGLLRPARLRQRVRRDLALVERRGPRHDVNGVDEELRRNPRFTLVFAEAEDAERRDDHHGRVRVAQQRRTGLRARPVVGHVLVAVAADVFGDALLQPREVFARGIPGHEHRTDPGPQEVIGTTGAHLAELGAPSRIRELERIVRPVEMRNHAAVRRHGAAEVRQERRRDRVAIDGRGHRRPSETRQP